MSEQNKNEQEKKSKDGDLGLTPIPEQKAPKPIHISEEKFMEIWNAAEISVMAENDLLAKYDLEYLREEPILSAKNFYAKFCILEGLENIRKSTPEHITEKGLIEKAIKTIMSYKKYGHLSMDIYYNDVDETFVCKFSRFTYDVEKEKHFRNKYLLDSLKDALNFVKNRGDLNVK